MVPFPPLVVFHPSSTRPSVLPLLVRPPVHLSVHPFICPYAHPFIHPFNPFVADEEKGLSADDVVAQAAATAAMAAAGAVANWKKNALRKLLAMRREPAYQAALARKKAPGGSSGRCKKRQRRR